MLFAINALVTASARPFAMTIARPFALAITLWRSAAIAVMQPPVPMLFTTNVASSEIILRQIQDRTDI